MRRLRVFESISIDGYFCDAHDDIRWAHAGSDDPEYMAWVGGNASGGGALLFGRKTYDEMVAFWPTPAAAQQLPIVARGMNAATKYVVAHSLEPTWHNTTALRGIEEVRRLKASEGPGITLLGSGSLAAQLGEAGLVDEYQLVIVPIALGAGRTVFTARRELSLVDQRTFHNGRVAVTYAAA
jgi:dihydrofolate reductase